MIRFRALGIAFLLASLLTTTLASASAQSADKPVSTDDVVAMTQVGLSDQIIIAKIRTHNKPADLSTESLVALKKAKVSDAVIAALIDPTAAPVAAAPSVTVSNSLLPPSTASGATTGYAGDPNDPLAPHESGIWVMTTGHDGKPAMVELERTAYQGAKTGGMFASAITYGIANAKSKAIIEGKAAYFDEKAAGLGGNSYFAAQNISNPNQFGLIRLEVQKNAREAEIGEFSMWGGVLRQ